LKKANAILKAVRYQAERKLSASHLAREALRSAAAISRRPPHRRRNRAGSRNHKKIPQVSGSTSRSKRSRAERTAFYA
jgi:hypothetical protein